MENGSESYIDSKNETVLVYVYIVFQIHVYMNMLLDDHLCIVNILLGSVTAHYREVSLYFVRKN